jgi:hypothetical protein
MQTDFVYTPCYCEVHPPPRCGLQVEENVYKLCEKLNNDSIYAVFISNATKSVPPPPRAI